MQTKDYEDFDLQIRSMLGDAEEQVPSRVWSGISSRLDAMQAVKAPAATHKGRRWAWAAAGLATAAALTVGVLFTGTRDNNSNLVNNNMNGLMAQVEPVQVAEPEKAVEAEALPSQDISRQNLIADAAQPSTPRQVAPRQTATRQQPQKQAVTEQEKPAESVKATETPVVPKEQVTGNPVATEKSPEKVSEKVSEQPTIKTEIPANKPAETGVAKEPSTYEDPFAAMEMEDRQKSQKRFHTSMYAGGSMSNNDAGAGSVAMGASGRSLTALQETSTSSYGIPISFGTGVRFHFAPRWSIGTGLDYSLLTRTFTGDYGTEQIVRSDVRHTIQYLGIPLNLYYNILNNRRINFYVFGGGEAEFCVSNKYKILEYPTTISDPIKNPQWSVGAGLGIEFKLGRNVGLYLDPSARYYFDCSQPKSIRTEKPFMLNLQTGLRFNF